MLLWPKVCCPSWMSHFTDYGLQYIWKETFSYTMQLEISNISTECCHQGESKEVWANTTIYSLHCWGYMSWRSGVSEEWSTFSSLWSSNQELLVLQLGSSAPQGYHLDVNRASFTSNLCPQSWSIINHSTGSCGGSLQSTFPSFSFSSGIMLWTGVIRRQEEWTNLHQPLTFNGM